MNHKASQNITIIKQHVAINETLSCSPFMFILCTAPLQHQWQLAVFSILLQKASRSCKFCYYWGQETVTASPEPSLPSAGATGPLTWPCVRDRRHVGKSTCVPCAAFRVMNSNIFWQNSAFTCAVTAHTHPKTSEIHLHDSQKGWCTFHHSFIDSSPNIKFNFGNNYNNYW